MKSTDDRDTASISGIPNRLANNYFDFQDGRIEQLKAELDAVRRQSVAWKQAAKMHREDELAFEQTIRGLEKDLTKARIESLTEYTWWSEWQQARNERDEARLQRDKAYEGHDKLLERIRQLLLSRRDDRNVARRLNTRLKAIEAAVPKMAVYDNFRDPVDAMNQMEHYIKVEIPKLRKNLQKARVVARRLLNDPIYRLRCIDRQWEKEGYDDPFEEAMELKKVLP